MKRIFLIMIVVFVLGVVARAVSAQEADNIKLAQPSKDQPLLQILQKRCSQRDFSAQELPLQELSDLLWAAWGINRPGSEKRTAPSSMDMREIDVYVSMQKGLYLYDAKENKLALVLKEDIREQTGKQPFVKEAPVNLIYVVDFSKMSRLSQQDKDFYAATDTGFISENVYLYCASRGLATVVRGWFDQDVLEKKMGLRKEQRVVLTQTVGFPKK